MIMVMLFVMSKIQILNGTHNSCSIYEIYFRLFVMSKIQILNGTHNGLEYFTQARDVVCDVKDTNFEWNSQLIVYFWITDISCLWCQRYKFWMELTTCFHFFINLKCCLWCQRYKFWMELTTPLLISNFRMTLFVMSKIQILNGTHNLLNSKNG